MGNALLAAALIAAAPNAHGPAAPIEDDARPAMFVIRDDDTTIYLFGTFHALDGRSEWFKDRVKTAFDGSGELVLETVMPEGPSIAAQSGPRTLPAAPSASMLATTRMVISAGRANGMQVGKGADSTLRRAAEVEGKPVMGLETPQLQFNMFSRMPQAAPAPARSPAGYTTPPDNLTMNALSGVMASLQSAWKRGDQRVFVTLLGQLEQSSPDTYRIMFTERNARWADWVSARMRTPGTVFVAVGTGHLVGKDSLLVRLAELGLPSARLN